MSDKYDSTLATALMLTKQCWYITVKFAKHITTTCKQLLASQQRWIMNRRI